MQLSNNRCSDKVIIVQGATCVLLCVLCSLARDETEGLPVLVPFRTRGSMERAIFNSVAFH